MQETMAGCFDPPICYEIPDNWEQNFFRAISQAQELENQDEDEPAEEVEDVAIISVVPKIKSYREAISCLEDVLCFLESTIV